jgi:hypothetical protein
MPEPKTLLVATNLEADYFEDDDTAGWPGRIVLDVEGPRGEGDVLVHDTSRWWRVRLPITPHPAVADVLIERQRQEQEYGATNARNTPIEWIGLITQHAGRAMWAWKECLTQNRRVATSAAIREEAEGIRRTKYREARRHLINAAALALAAIEALDNQFGPQE